MKKNLFFVALVFASVVANAQDVATKVNGVNTEFDEIFPRISPDGKTMFFSRSLYHENKGGKTAGQDIYVSNKTESGWSEAKNLGSGVNTTANEVVCGFSADGSKIYLNNAYSKRSAKSGISMAGKSESGSWVKLENMEFESGELNNPKGFFEYYIGYNDSVAIFSLNISDSLSANQDLHISFKKADGKWTMPKNLGSTLNTGKSEMAPYLSADGKTLFFTSDGRQSGNADIFYSERMDGSFLNWSEPIALSPLVNTEGYETHFTFDPEEKTIYFVRADMALAGAGDIYTISKMAVFPPAPEPVVEPKPEPQPEPVAVVEAKPEPKPEPKVFVGVNVTVFFDYNSAVLSDATKTELTKAVEGYQKNKNDFSMELKVVGHADARGAEQYNQTLSLKRANAVKTFLINKGLAKKVIVTVGKGELEPIADNNTDEGMAKNRRVEISLDKK